MNPPSTNFRAYLFRVALGLSMLTAAGGIAYQLKHTAPTLETTDADQRPPLRVQVMRPSPVTISRQWRGQGAAQAKDSADVPARVNTTVVTIPDNIEAGVVVELGQILAQLDPTDFEREAQVARTQLDEIDASIEQLDLEDARLQEGLAIEQQEADLLRVEYEHQRSLQERGQGTRQDVDRAHRARLDADRMVINTQQAIDAIRPRRAGLNAQHQAVATRLDIAEENVTRCTITSPIAGLVAELDIEAGESLTSGQRVARIVNPQVIEVPLQLPASARAQIAVGNDVILSSRSHRGCLWPAKVVRLSAVNASTRTFTVYADWDQTGITLDQFATGGASQGMPVGAFVSAVLTTSDSDQRWVIPARSIQEGRIRLLDKNNQITSRQVQIAFRHEGVLPQFNLPDTQWVVLEDPLEPDVQVVLSASLAILDGQRVEPIYPRQAPNNPAGASGDGAAGGGSAPNGSGGGVSP